MRAWWADFEPILREGESLSRHTTFGLGGPARWMACPRGEAQLAALVSRCESERIGWQVLGLGANLLISDAGVDGMVIRLQDSGFKQVDWPTGPLADHPVRVTAGGGVDMHRLVLEAVRRGLGGIEGLAGIPGTLGGIVRMNAGGRWGEIREVVRAVTVVDPQGRCRVLAAEEAGFRYRGSNLAGSIVCQVELELTPGDPAVLRECFLEYWSSKSQSQPLGLPSAGCVFKNPPGGSAGQLIDRAGLKGRGVGGVRVSQRHANFIVAEEGATAADAFALIGQIQDEVAQRFGVELELEIEVWGKRHVGQPDDRLAPVA